MIKNFFKIAWRNLLRKKSFSFINITGLSIGMAAAILILFWIQHELTFDKYYKDQDRIYQAWNRYEQEGKVNCWTNTPKPMAKAIQQDYPEVEHTVRVEFIPPILFSVGDKRMSARGNILDSTFFSVFSFPVL